MPLDKGESVKILLLDDHPLFRKGIVQTLHDIDASHVVVEANTAEQALGMLKAETDIDGVFLDLTLPDMSGFDFLAELREQRIPVPVIILSADETPEVVDRGLRAGASGYLTKAVAGEEIAAALHALESTGSYVSRSLKQPLNHYRAEQIEVNGLLDTTLTRRQRQVLELLAQGLSNLQIATALNISESTVKGHASTLFSIFNADNRTQCVNEARKYHLLT